MSVRPLDQVLSAGQRDGKPWITRLPFPVHVVERVETYDHVSGNRFVTRYAYHHGYFDGDEREFRGFGMVEQWDTEEFARPDPDGRCPRPPTSSHRTCRPSSPTWFHTGVYLGRSTSPTSSPGCSMPTTQGEYYREPGSDRRSSQRASAARHDHAAGLTLAEEREACRALKGAMLRQEVYALDGTDKAETPYTVTEQNFTIRLQPRVEIATRFSSLTPERLSATTTSATRTIRASATP